MLEDSLEFAGSKGRPAWFLISKRTINNYIYRIECDVIMMRRIASRPVTHAERVLAGRAAASAPPGALRAAPGPGQWSREAERSSIWRSSGMWVCKGMC